jgi:hypothetical protein
MAEVVSLMHQLAALYSQEDSWYTFLLEAELTPTAIIMEEKT